MFTPIGVESMYPPDILALPVLKFVANRLVAVKLPTVILENEALLTTVILPTLIFAQPLLLIEDIPVPVSVVAIATKFSVFSSQTQAVFTEPYEDNDARFLFTSKPMLYPANDPV